MCFPGFKKNLNRDAISNFLRHGYIPSPNSIFQNTFKLQPGKILTIDQKKFFPQIKSFWSLENIVKNRSLINIGNSEIIKSLDNLLTDSE